MEDRRWSDRQTPNPSTSQTRPNRSTGPQRKKAKRKPRRERPPETPPPPSNTSPPDDLSFHSLKEDITCSICLDDLQDPVSIACGHTFCRTCITTHWNTPQPAGYLCPECRKMCPRYQMTPDYRLMNLISKIQIGVQEKAASSEEGSPVFSDLGYPVQLVWTDGSGCLHLDESVVYDCFMNPELSSFPVYLLCVIGEKRRGKSFLMNYILRALESQEKGEEFSLGAEDEPLQGFEWRSGIDSTTKGLWMWSRPFILGNKGEKVAVYVLDTEGSLDIEGDRESCIKLSALSMLLSSHLLLTDMDEDFQENLRAFIADLVRGVWHRTKTDRTGELLTCSDLSSVLQEFVIVLERQKYGFSTPMEMFYAIKNQKILESLKMELADFLSIQPSHLLPSTMRTLISEKSEQLTKKFSESLLGPNSSQHAGLLRDLECHLQEEQEKFCSGYTTRFTCNAIGLGLTAGIGLYGVVGAAAARGTVVLATQPAVVAAETAVAGSVASGAVNLLKGGVSALMGRFFRGGL
ncbi:RING finger protein 112-like [Mantella aurantiaca]